MTESILLPAGILLATATLGVLAAVSLAGSAPSAPAPRLMGALTQLRCPTAEDLVSVRIGLDPAAHSLSVLWCERFGHGAITCDRGCFPSAPLEAIAF